MKEFDNILDECLERLLVQGETLEQCLRRYPQQAAELKPLLETALAAKEAAAVQPRPEFRARARYQFRAALQEKMAPKRRRFLGWMPQWATALAIVLVLLLAGGGTVAAATNSMPDSFLYPVKLATEEVQLALTTSQVDKAELCSRFTDRRIAEIVYMAEQGDAQQIELITQRLDEDLEMLAVYSAGLGEDGAEMLMMATTDSGGDTAVTSGDTTGSGQEEAAADEDSLLTEGATAPAESGSGWGRDGSGGQGVNAQAGSGGQAKIQAAVSDSAANNTAALRELLEEASPAVRAALLRAIAVSEAGYQHVLDALGY